MLTQSSRSVALYSPLMSPVSATTTVSCFNWSREVAMVHWRRGRGEGHAGKATNYNKNGWLVFYSSRRAQDCHWTRRVSSQLTCLLSALLSAVLEPIELCRIREEPHPVSGHSGKRASTASFAHAQIVSGAALILNFCAREGVLWMLHCCYAVFLALTVCIM